MTQPAEPDDFDVVVEQLRPLQDKYQSSPHRSRFRLPRPLVGQIVSAVQARQRQGQSLRQLALRLGLAHATLSRWCHAQPQPGPPPHAQGSRRTPQLP